ncbi:hypothetical protein Cob_v006283 [Colletotrichum orbiculare MAFF 240422]|uniref:Uncharacterized protein n=1 Tax=Colletotrichum orbiculare (strain 104-T / ATCC 96160 / CBS 514.97 / LARS 414 / MAFF 240422) TaxID=1213857 RepID=A0A484FSL2_COLOR|nr:hypothetical protein Cob_v006283 [Colletotrichum orbiculare MAFF 240422]
MYSFSTLPQWRQPHNDAGPHCTCGTQYPAPPLEHLHSLMVFAPLRPPPLPSLLHVFRAVYSYTRKTPHYGCLLVGPSNTWTSSYAKTLEQQVRCRQSKHGDGDALAAVTVGGRHTAPAQLDSFMSIVTQTLIHYYHTQAQRIGHLQEHAKNEVQSIVLSLALREIATEEEKYRTPHNPPTVHFHGVDTCRSPSLSAASTPVECEGLCLKTLVP